MHSHLWQLVLAAFTSCFNPVEFWKFQCSGSRQFLSAVSNVPFSFQVFKHLGPRQLSARLSLFNQFLLFSVPAYEFLGCSMQQCLIFSCFTFFISNKSNLISLSAMTSMLILIRNCWINWSLSLQHFNCILWHDSSVLQSLCQDFFSHARTTALIKTKTKALEKKMLFQQLTLALVSGYQDAYNQQPLFNRPLEHGTKMIQYPISGEFINCFVVCLLFCLDANGDYLTTHMFYSY